MAPLLRKFHDYFGDIAKENGFVKHKQGYMRIVNDVLHGFNLKSYFGGKSGTIEFCVWPLSLINHNYIGKVLFGLQELVIITHEKNPEFVMADFFKSVDGGMEELLELFKQYLLPYFDQSTDAESAYKTERAFIRLTNKSHPIVSLSELEDMANNMIEDLNYKDADPARSQFCLQFGDKKLAYCHLKLYIEYRQLSYIRRLPSMSFESDKAMEEEKERFLKQFDSSRKKLKWINDTPIEQIQAALLEEQKKNLEILKWKG